MEAIVQTKQDIFKRLNKHREKLQNLGVSRLGIFGSFKHNKQTADSDC